MIRIAIEASFSREILKRPKLPPHPFVALPSSGRLLIESYKIPKKTPLDPLPDLPHLAPSNPSSSRSSLDERIQILADQCLLPDFDELLWQMPQALRNAPCPLPVEVAGPILEMAGEAAASPETARSNQTAKSKILLNGF